MGLNLFSVQHFVHTQWSNIATITSRDVLAILKIGLATGHYWEGYHSHKKLTQNLYVKAFNHQRYWNDVMGKRGDFLTFDSYVNTIRDLRISPHFGVSNWAVKQEAQEYIYFNWWCKQRETFYLTLKLLWVYARRDLAKFPHHLVEN